MTFSITGGCHDSGMAGIAITTSSICVGSRCPWVQAGAGAVSTQNITDPTIGNEVLDLLANGSSASDALDNVMDQRANAEYRQVAVVDMSGRTAHFSGQEVLGIHAVSEGQHCVGAGNLLSDVGVTQAMCAVFEKSIGRHLAERLLQALEAGVAAGGEKGPTHSAALLVAHEQPWPLVDLRVDWAERPVDELRRCWERYEPEMMAYLTRALNPGAAPTYGVPGDE